MWNTFIISNMAFYTLNEAFEAKSQVAMMNYALNQKSDSRSKKSEVRS
jgi:hypothetical protein